MAGMKEELAKLIFSHTDHELRVTDVMGLIEAIEELYEPKTDWASIDSEKWGELDENISV